MLKLSVLSLAICCLASCCTRLYRPNITVTPPPIVVTCEIPPYPELYEVDELDSTVCKEPALYCLDNANAMRLLANELKKKAWREEVKARCQKPAVSPTSQPTDVTTDEGGVE